MSQDCVLVCDLGGTSLRVALFDAQGGKAADWRAPLASGLEADPDDWFALFAAGAQAVADAAPASFARCRAVAISAFTRSQVFLDAGGRSLRPAILWADARAADGLEDLRARCPADHPELATLNAYHPLARLWWLKRTEPERAAALSAVLDPKDYLNFRLTGVLRRDPVSTARLQAAAAPGPDGRSLFDAAGFSPALLPPAVPPTAIMGAVRPGLTGALGLIAGAPVMTMANDTWASVVGLGALRDGWGYNISGTTEVFGLISATPRAASGLLTVDWGEGLTQIGGPSQTGADALLWLRDLMETSDEAPEAALERLLATPRHRDPLIFLPYLQGERVPYWDSELRGAFLGLGRRHGRVDLVWAVMEGVAFLNRIVLERAEAAVGSPAREIRIGGGGSASPVWRQIKANVLNRTVVAPVEAQQGLLGAAIVAWTGLGRFATLSAAQESLARPGARHDPDPAAVARYDRLYQWHREAESAVAPISRRLATWAEEESTR
ncbi:MAG: xylulokinase [Elsteraceae bacterium]